MSRILQITNAARAQTVAARQRYLEKQRVQSIAPAPKVERVLAHPRPVPVSVAKIEKVWMREMREMYPNYPVRVFTMRERGAFKQIAEKYEGEPLLEAVQFAVQNHDAYFMASREYGVVPTPLLLVKHMGTYVRDMRDGKNPMERKRDMLREVVPERPSAMERREYQGKERKDFDMGDW